MALVAAEDFDPHYTEFWREHNIMGYSLYSDVGTEKVGSVENILVDEASGVLRYLVVNIGFWVFGKQILLPIGLARIDFETKRVYAKGLTKEQAEHLPAFNDSLRIDPDYEEQLQRNYLSYVSTSVINSLGAPVDPLMPVSPIAVDGLTATLAAETAADSIDKQKYLPPEAANHYDSAAYLYGINEADHSHIKRYSEQLIKNRLSKPV